MKRYLFKTVLLMFLLFSTTLYAQSFTWNVPHTTIIGNPGDFLVIESYLINNSSSIVQYRVIVSDVNMPATWGGSYCPGALCLPFQMDTSMVFNLTVGSTDTFTVEMFTDNTPAVGYVTMKIENINNPSEYYQYSFGFSTGPNAINGNGGQLPTVFQLEQNYPNPFNPETAIPFKLENAGNVKLEIFNNLGQKVRTLADGFYTPGVYEVKWDGRNDFGVLMPSGNYVYRLQHGLHSQIRKMTLIK